MKLSFPLVKLFNYLVCLNVMLDQGDPLILKEEAINLNILVAVGGGEACFFGTKHPEEITVAGELLPTPNPKDQHWGAQMALEGQAQGLLTTGVMSLGQEGTQGTGCPGWGYGSSSHSRKAPWKKDKPTWYKCRMSQNATEYRASNAMERG